MPYRIAGIDVHKKMLAVVVADVEVDGDFHFERRNVGTTPVDLRGLADWLVEQEVSEVPRFPKTAWGVNFAEREGGSPHWTISATVGPGLQP